MQACKFTMITAVDEKENTVTYDGKIDIGDTIIVLLYEEGPSQVCITLQKGMALIDRQGDYSLRLQLEEGKTKESGLGIGGSEGTILTKTYRVKYSFANNIFKLSLCYDLIFSENEAQRMKLNLKGQIKR